MNDDTDNVKPPLFSYSHTLSLSANVQNGVLCVQIKGTPQDFQNLAECAARGGGVVVLSTAIQETSRVNR